MTIYAALLMSGTVFFPMQASAQAPNKMSYQAVIRNSSNALVTNSAVGMRISILQTSATGTAVYVETQNSTTNANGLASLEIGGGTVLSGNFANINWANGPYFIKTETDPTGGTSYTITGTSQLLSVPYALYAGNGVPYGGSSGQVLTNCNGILTWTTGGQCPPVAGSITALNCTTATNNGTLTAGLVASGVSSIVPYTGGNGGTHNGQTVTSTGVTGLTATLAVGTFANGSGSLTYTITGTAATSGTANFSLNIGGQNCTLSRTVNPGGGIVSNPGAGVTFNGYIYASIVLGNGQEWMAENLRTTTYRNGDPIPNVTDPNQWNALTTGAWAHYDNNSQYENPYGKLYNWFAVNDSRNVCPTGWHVPSDAEWSTFINYLDPNANGGSSTNTAGGKMKSTGTQYWQSPNQNATNESGFSGLPGGYRYANGTYSGIGFDGYWWSSTEGSTDDAWSRYLGYDSGFVYRDNDDKKNGFSVRCLRD